MHIDHFIAKYGISLFLIAIVWYTSPLHSGIYSQCSEVFGIATLLQFAFINYQFRQQKLRVKFLQLSASLVSSKPYIW